MYVDFGVTETVTGFGAVYVDLAGMENVVDFGAVYVVLYAAVVADADMPRNCETVFISSPSFNEIVERE